MPSKNNNKGVKMSLGDFMGGAPTNDMDGLPTAPRQRGPDDDGSFQRRRRDDGPDREISRADQDGSWRKGGGGRGFGDRDDRGGGGGFRDDRGGFDRRGGGYRDDRGGGFDRRGGDDRGGFDRRGGDDRGGFDRRGGGRDGGFDRGGPGPAPAGERPRLQLKARSSAKEEPKKGGQNVAPPQSNAKVVETAQEKPNEDALKGESEPALTEENPAPETAEAKNDDPDRKRREPAVVNSRAAMLGDAPDARRDSNMRRDRGDKNSRGPPPVVNKRFADMADEEREKNKERETRKPDRFSPRDRDDQGPPPVANSRFAAAAEADRSTYRDRDERGPPPVANSRFAAAAEADRSTYRSRDERGPPPVANSRFAAAAEADRSTYRDRDERGPPPVANSRFAAAAEADRSTYIDRDERGPPPLANSRFAAAAAMVEEERRDRDGPGRDRDGFGDPRRGGPVPQNSRFAAAVAADEDYVEPSQRGYGGDRGRFDDRGRGDRFDRRGRDDNDRPGRGGYDKYNGGGYEDGPATESEPPKSSVADLLKPKARPMEENILKVPSKEQASNILKLPSKDDGDNVLAPTKKETKSAPAAAPVPAPAVDASPVVDDGPVIAEFISGGKLGEDLKAWVGEQVISSVEKLVYTFLEENQKLNPDVTCAWAEPDKYGAALVSLVEDDLLKQVEVLFAIQKYCNKIGMPKLNDEYVIQSMFRSMYKYDLASDEAYEMWKEDESAEHEAGKVNAVIQTVDWFNWLEQEDEEEEDYEE